MKKRLMALLLTVAMLASVLIAPSGAASLPFTDVTANSWYYGAVSFVYEQEIMSGMSATEFGPDQNLTRAQAAQLLYNYEGKPIVGGDAFTDVAQGQWYYNAVNWAAAVGVVSGLGDGIFAPNNDLTREQLVTILMNYARYKGYDTTESASLAQFTDADQVSSWAVSRLQWAVAEKLISGMGDGEIAPKRPATRAQVAAIMKNFVQRIEKGEESEYDRASLLTVNFDLSAVPAYSGNPYVAVNGNIPLFATTNLPTEALEYYSELDALGRCGVTYANVCKEIMPTEARGDIGSVKPSGWQTVKYDIVEGKYLYNRCHLIGYQLAGENANVCNLITGTRYLNIRGMLPFENMIDDYVEETGNHVLYRVTPIFARDNLVASGVLMEGYSVEDQGEGIAFCVFAYNVQPGITIDYQTGESKESEETTPSEEPGDQDNSDLPVGDVTYVLNTSSKKFHDPTCSTINSMNEENKQEYGGTREELIAQGYEPCGRCKP